MKWISPVLALMTGVAIGFLLFGGGGVRSGTDGDDLIFAEFRRAAQASGDTAGPPADGAGPGSARPDPVAPAAPAEISEEWLVSLEDLSPVEQMAAFYIALRGLPAGRYGELIEEFRESDAALRWQFIGALERQWADIDPVGMLAYLDASDSKLDDRLRRAAVRGLAKADLDSAWSYAAGLPQGGERDGVTRRIIEVAAEADPYRALQLLDSAGGRDRNLRWMYRTVFQRLAETDPEGASRMAAELPVGEAKVNALHGVMQERFNDDPAAAFAWLDSLEQDSSVYRARQRTGQFFSQLGFEKARDLIDNEQDPRLRRRYLESLDVRNMLDDGSFDEVVAVYDWLGENSLERVQGRHAYALVEKLMARDPERATAFVLDLPPGQFRNSALSNYASQLAQRDPDAALAFAASLPYDDERNRVLSGLGHVVMRDGPEAAAAFLAKAESAEMNKRFAGQIVNEWAAYDRVGAMAWMEGLDDEDAFRQAQQSLVRAWVLDDSHAAFAYIEQNFEGKERDHAFRNAVQGATWSDPMSAVRWLGEISFEDENVRNRLHSDVARAYMDNDPIAASEWIAGLEPGAARDHSVNSLVRSTANFDPDSGLIWAATIDDDKMRESALKQSVRAWVRRDPDAAYQGVRSADISDEERTELFKIVEDAR